MSATINLGSKKSGAALVRYALEQLPVSHTFGIPGVHNTEIYDELNKSDTIHPVLVTHECGAAFMADGVSRTGSGEIGVLVIVPAAGMTHALSGIGEAFLDGVPMLVISGGTRTDVEFGYQLHEFDQLEVVRPITKAAIRIKTHDEIVQTIFEAYRLAVSGCPGPVFVEVPVNLQLFGGAIGPVPAFEAPAPGPAPDEAQLEAAAKMLLAAEHPAIFVGWGAVDATEALVEIAECLGAPVSTTLQGQSSFPANHPLHTGMGFSRASVPAAEHAFEGCDCLLALGLRFGEIPTGSFGCTVPDKLIHIDIDPEVLGRNFKPAIGIVADNRLAAPALLAQLRRLGPAHKPRRPALPEQIATDKRAYTQEWLAHKSQRVNPAAFFSELRRVLDDDAITVVDDGNHTFLASELYEVRKPRSFISPTDFNCMGYAVPAAIGAKLVNPSRQVAAIVGDGAFLMTGMELLTASTQGAGVACFVFYDGELSQISQGQEIPYNRKTCTVIGEVKLEGMAMATGAAYLRIDSDAQLAELVPRALELAAHGQPVVVDVRIDYSKRTRFTKGVVKTNLKRFPLGEKVRFVGRALVRKVTG